MTEPMPVSFPAPEALPDPLPPITATRAPAGTGSSTFVALSEDATLREVIAGAVATRGVVVEARTPQVLADELVARPDAIAILDLALVTGNAALFIERLRAQFPALVLVAVGGPRDQAVLAPLVAEGSVCRFAHKPVSAQRLGLFLDAALRRREALAHENRAVLLAPLRPSNSNAARVAVFILLLIAAAGTGLWLLRRPAVPASPGAAPTAVPAAPPATAATEPTPPASAAIGAAGKGDANKADAGTGDAAAGDDPAAQARHEAQLARRLMDVGLLIDPPNNSALSHINAATRLAPQDPEVRRAARALSGRLVNAMRNALLAQDLPAAQRWFDAARDYGVNAATLGELDEQLQMLKGMLGQ